MSFVCIRLTATGEKRRMDNPVWVRAGRNGPLRCHRVQAQGVGDGSVLYALPGSPLDYPAAEVISYAEYLENKVEDSDPELSAEEALAIITGQKQ